MSLRKLHEWSPAILEPRHIAVYLFFILQFALPSGSRAQTTWYTFKSPDKDFIVSFPGKPAYAPVADPRTSQKIERFSLTFENHYMEVQYIELPRSPETREQIAASLEGIKSGYLKALKDGSGRLLRLSELPRRGYQFDSTSPLEDGTIVHNRTRVYLFGARQYNISCVTWNKAGLNELLAARFLNSFTITTPSTEGAENKIKSKKLRRSNRGPHKKPLGAKRGAWNPNLHNRAPADQFSQEGAD